MASQDDPTVRLSLAIMRFSAGAFFLVWAAGKVVAPDIARGAFETFYFSSPSDTALLVIGLAQAAIIIAFMSGVLRFWTYGALLAMHSVSLLSTVPRLLDPFSPPNSLFWAAVPVWALLLVLFLLRERDTALVWPRRAPAALAAPLAAVVGVSVVPAAAAAPNIHSFAAQPKLVDTTNTHWIETEDAIVVVDTQRIFPEAERAVRHIERLNKPVVGIFVTHPHTDHYGGLSVFKAAFPDAPVFAAEETIRSMREDSRGYNAARLARHGDLFPTQDVISAHLPDQVIDDGDVIELAGLRLEVHEMGPSEAEVTSTLYLGEAEALFAGDLINNGFVPAPLESLDGWLPQLDAIEQRYPATTTLYIGHGAHGPLGPLVDAQRRYLLDLQSAVAAATEDGVLDATDAAAVAFDLEARYPHWHGVGGNPRIEVLSAVAGFVAGQRGAEVTSDAAFR